ncbi:hypothetical protein OC842_006132 [Tilletia horrida]|uniref:DUF7082 domain-containing protein n=1 Tax=Tilletia horrida TaxID=155126 RepID=A0AAN6G633_9BASI|nr:hypothetical protein OC842_006132 [Tilletia horrida]KAK0558300.1 hypothetical protein OC844_005261 [Tilletia horrida]
MASESSSLNNVTDLHGSHHHQHHHQGHSGGSGGPSSSFHPSAAPYLGGGYGSYMMPGEGSGTGMGGGDISVSSFNSVRNPLKRAGDDLDSLASGAGRLSPRERERERERLREQTSMSLAAAAREAEEQAQALRRPASFPILGANGASAPYMGGTTGMGNGGPGMAAPSTPSGSGFLPSSTSDNRFRAYGPTQGTPTSVGPVQPMSTPFGFTPRSPYDDSMAGTSSLMHTPASHQHTPYQHSHSHSYSQSSHTGHPHDLVTSTPPPPMGVPTGVPDFMRSSHGPLEHHVPHYAAQNSFDSDAYHGGRGPSSMPMPGSVPQSVPAMPEGAPRASLEIEGDLERQVFGWDHEEWTNGRRLLQFWRRQEGTTIHASFKNVLQREYDQPDGPRGIIISCIFRPDKNECFITSVDLIYLLESLINNRFTVEEKNRIRRNLEGFRPITISKNKPDCSAFFKRIMGFPAPKPRNIEKDVKVFAWSSLRPALCKIVGKYYASYTPGTAGGPSPGLAMGHDMGPAGSMGGPSSNSPAGSGSLALGGGPSMPLGVVGMVSRTPSLEQQIHRGGSGASLRSPATVGGAPLQGSPLGGNANSSLSGPGASAMGSMTSSGSGGGYSHSHPLALQGGSNYGGHGDYHAAHSTSSTPTPGAGPAGPGAFPYADYMQPQSAYGQGSGLSSLNGTPAMPSVGGVGTPGGGPAGHRNVSGSSSNPPSGTAGSVGLGLGPSPMPPPSSTAQGSNYVYSPSATGTSGAASTGYNAGSMLGSLAAATGQAAHSSMSSSGASGTGSHPSPGPAASNNSMSGGSNSFPVPVIGGASGDVSNDFASGILPAPQPGRARGLSASLAAATSTGGFRRN